MSGGFLSVAHTGLADTSKVAKAVCDINGRSFAGNV